MFMGKHVVITRKPLYYKKMCHFYRKNIISFTRKYVAVTSHSLLQENVITKMSLQVNTRKPAVVTRRVIFTR